MAKDADDPVGQYMRARELFGNLVWVLPAVVDAFAEVQAKLSSHLTQLHLLKHGPRAYQIAVDAASADDATMRRFRGLFKVDAPFDEPPPPPPRAAATTRSPQPASADAPPAKIRQSPSLPRSVDEEEDESGTDPAAADAAAVTSEQSSDSDSADSAASERSGGGDDGLSERGEAEGEADAEFERALMLLDDSAAIAAAAAAAAAESAVRDVAAAAHAAALTQREALRDGLIDRLLTRYFHAGAKMCTDQWNTLLDVDRDTHGVGIRTRLKVEQTKAVGKEARIPFNKCSLELPAESLHQLVLIVVCEAPELLEDKLTLKQLQALHAAYLSIEDYAAAPAALKRASSVDKKSLAAAVATAAREKRSTGFCRHNVETFSKVVGKSK